MREPVSHLSSGRVRTDDRPLTIAAGEDHKPIGTRDLDIGRFLDRLAAANFTGPLVFELKVDEALESLNVVKSIRPNYIKE